VRQAITGGIRNVDYISARFDYSFCHLCEKSEISTAGIFSKEFYLKAFALRILNCPHTLL